MSDMDDKESWVRRRAYQLWQEGGGEHGQHEDHWHRAEREYDAAMGPSPGDAPTGDLGEDLIEAPPPAGEAEAGADGHIPPAPAEPLVPDAPMEPVEPARLDEPTAPRRSPVEDD